MDTTQTLPVWLQMAVGLATIISSIGVIAAFVQIYISIRQFKGQLRITQDQLKLSEAQFTLINQGYLSPEFDINLYSPDVNDKTEIKSSTTFQTLSTVVNLNNTGNLPVIYQVKEFNLYFNGAKIYSLQDNQEIAPGTVYPKQISPYLINAPLKNDNTRMSVDEVSKTNITCSILIHYNDFNSKRTKIINRNIKYNISLEGCLPTYLQISDSI
jgi:hypothetical protein